MPGHFNRNHDDKNVFFGSKNLETTQQRASFFFTG